MVFFNPLFIRKDNSFFDIFKNPTIQKQITTKSSMHDSFFYVTGFVTTCDLNKRNYYVLDGDRSEVVQYDQNWNYLNTFFIPSTNGFISVVVNNLRFFYALSYWNQIYQFDTNFNIINRYSYNNRYYGYSICFNSATNHVLATSRSGILILDQNLTLIRNYDFLSDNSYSMNIIVYNDIVYVSASNGVIWVLVNETATMFFNTLCSLIQSMLIDSFGYIAILCSDSTIYVYSSSGIYMNFTLTNLVLHALSLGFDYTGNLAITGYNGIYIINTSENTTLRTLDTNSTIDNSCINKSI